MKEKVNVQIYGRNYEIETDIGDALYINSLARIVEEKMKEVANSTNIVDSGKLAVLAALNIADELYRMQQNRDTSVTSANKKTDELLTLLDTVLE